MNISTYIKYFLLSITLHIVILHFPLSFVKNKLYKKDSNVVFK